LHSDLRAWSQNEIAGPTNHHTDETCATRADVLAVAEFAGPPSASPWSAVDRFLAARLKNLLGNRLVPFSGDTGQVRFKTVKRDVMV
jgi:hypothetical protein